MAVEIATAYVSLLPQFTGVKAAIGNEFDGVGQSLGQSVGKQFSAGFGAAAQHGGAAVITRLSAGVESASRVVAAARQKELDISGKLRVAETQLTEARAKYGAESSQVARAEERVAAIQRQAATASADTLSANTRLTAAQGDLAKATDQAAESTRRSISLSNEQVQALGTVGKVVAAAGGGIAVGLGAAAKVAADFESGLSGIKAVSGATAAQMNLIRDAALRIGKDTAFSASEAADAMSELVKAGVPIKAVLNGAADATVALAAASGVSLPEAANIAANAMNQFQLSARQLPKVADLIAGAANASAIDVSQFGYSLQQVGAVANLAGVSFDDTAVAIAELGNAGIVGSDAGTSLKTMLANLQPQTEKASAALEELGIVTKDGTNRFYDQTGKLKPLIEIQRLLHDGTKDLTKAQAQSALQTAFGSDAIRAAAILAQNGAKGYTELAGAMTKVTAADVAATRLQNFNGALEQLRGSVETVAIKIGSVLLPIFGKVVAGITDFVNQLGDLNPTILTIGTIVAGVVSVLALLGGGFVAVAAAVAPVVTALGGIAGIGSIIGGAFAVVTGPIGIAVAAIVAAGVALTAFFTQTQVGRDAFAGLVQVVQGAFQAIANFVGPIIAAVGGFVTSLVPVFQTGWAQVTASVQQFITFVRSNVLPVVAPIFQTVGDALTGFVPAAIDGFNGVRDALVGFIGFLQDNVGPILAGVFSFIAQKVQEFTAIAKKVWTDVQPGLQPLVDFFVNVIGPQLPAIMQVVGAAVGVLAGVIGIVLVAPIGIAVAAVGLLVAALIGIGAVVSGVVTFLAGAVPAIGNVFATVFGAIGGFVSGAINIVVSIVTTGITFVQGIVTAGLGVVRTVFAAVWGAIGPIVTSAMTSVSSIIGSVISIVQSLVAAGLFYVRTIFTTVFNALVGIITPPLNTARSVVQTVITAIQTIFSSVFGAVRAFVTSVFGQIQAAISGPINTARSVVQSAVSTIQSAVSSAFNSARSTVTSIMSGIVSAVQTGIGRVIDFFSGLKDRILGAISGIAGAAFSAGASIVKRLVDGLLSGLAAIAAAAARIANAVKDALPHSPAKTGPFSGSGWTAVKTSGIAITRQLASGLIAGRSYVEREMNRLSGPLAAGVNVSGTVNSELASVGASAPGDGVTLKYYAAPNQSLDAEQDLRDFMRRTHALLPA